MGQRIEVSMNILNQNQPDVNANLSVNMLDFVEMLPSEFSDLPSFRQKHAVIELVTLFSDKKENPKNDQAS